MGLPPIRPIVVISLRTSQGLAPLQHLSHCLGSPWGSARSVPCPPIPGPSSVAELCISGWVRCCAVLACVDVLAPRSSLPAKLPRLAESRDATHPLARKAVVFRSVQPASKWAKASSQLRPTFSASVATLQLGIDAASLRAASCPHTTWLPGQHSVASSMHLPQFAIGRGSVSAGPARARRWHCCSTLS